LLVPLFQAERAWAYAMQLKQESNTDPRKKFHLINRLRKAVKQAGDLEKLCCASSKCDARTKLETQAYSYIMVGQFHFETQKWVESLSSFSLAKKIYESLSVTLQGDEAQVFYAQKVDEIIPNIRYCNYNLGDESAKKDLVEMKLKSTTGTELAESIDSLISQTKENQITSFSEVTWRNKLKLQIKNEKVKLFLLNVQEYEKQIQTANGFDVKISIYENILKESVDVIQLIRDELKLDQNFQLIQRGQPLAPDEKPSNMLLLFGYLTWTRMSKTIERNLLMIESYKNSLNKPATPEEENNNTSKTKTAKPQDIVRIYDIILQNIKDMSNLPGLSNDKQYLIESEFLTSYYKMFRSYYICLFYLSTKKYNESVGFIFKVETYIKQVEASFSATMAKTQDLNKTDLDASIQELKREVNQSKYKIQSAAILEANDTSNDFNPEFTKDQLDKIPLCDRLDIYYEDNNLLNKNPNLVRLPLEFEPIPFKPLFFDLALNHVELPNYDDKIDRPTGSQQSQASVKGFIKGIFGFK